ncbi:hypothetical protein F5B18DRAFT_640213 [Nemania serpens]|nr:hypothetical protein F5B18DRAFT_640213 [Nemania serpens]
MQFQIVTMIALLATGSFGAPLARDNQAREVSDEAWKEVITRGTADEAWKEVITRGTADEAWKEVISRGTADEAWREV